MPRPARCGGPSSKEAYADGIAAAVDAYWNWQQTRAGKRAGKRVGFPRFKKKGRDADRVCFTTGAMRVEPDRRHLTLPVIGMCGSMRTPAASNASSGRSCADAGDLGAPQWHPAGCGVRVLIQRPQQPRVAPPDSRVGVDVGVRRPRHRRHSGRDVIEQVGEPRAARGCTQRAAARSAAHVRAAGKAHGAT